MFLVSEIEAVTLTCSLQRVRSIDEKHGVRDVVFLAQFPEEDLGQTEILRDSKLDMEEFARGGIDGSVQPVSLVIDLDHSLVNRDVIRAPVLGGL